MSDPLKITIPDIGDFESVDVIEVLIVSGESVQAEDPLITLESDKATMDVPSPAAGRITEVTVTVGDKVSQGSLVALLDPAEMDVADIATVEIIPQAQPAQTVATPAIETAPQPALPPVQPETATQSPLQPLAPPSTLPPPLEGGSKLPHASPAVRRFARELGVDLSQINGAGARGRILQEDIRQFVKAALIRPASDSRPIEGAGIPPMPEVDFSHWGPIDTKPISRIQRLSGRYLHRAWLNIPHVTHHDDADITELESFRQSLKQDKAHSGTRITILSFLMKTVVSALKAFPTFNASLSPDGESLTLKQYFHIGVAVDTDNGLVVPVIRDVDSKGVVQLAKELAEISARARDGKLKLGEMQGGCMSISSLGGIGGTAFTPIVNAPEVAILGVTRSRMTPVWNGTEFQPRLMLPLDLSYDHRVIDGAQAARFMAFLSAALEDARRLLL
jgi:pyruvate dehydrogenase E2 component (dihydrolipoamide acetyltransferase)